MSMPTTARERLPDQTSEVEPPNGSKPQSRFRVLVIDDEQLVVELMTRFLESEGFDAVGVTEISNVAGEIQRIRPDLVFMDLAMPGVKGMELLERIIDLDSRVDVILATGNYSTDSAVEAIQKGAYDYFTKPIDFDRLAGNLSTWKKQARLRQRAEQLESELANILSFSGIIGRSPLVMDMISRIQRVAPHYQTALITGDTGTGKELVANAFHHMSPAKGRFAVCNCAALVETLFESELFGHVRGAFTGATQDKQGLLEYAAGGTVFLDEIGEMPIVTQAKLLRVVQNREVQRLGSPVVRKIDVRIVAATNRDLKQMVADGEFREDLYYRLATVQIKVPRLIDRREDLPILERHFLDMFAAKFSRPRFELSRKAQTFIARYPWPGNIRELENVLAYCCMVSERSTIDLNDFPEWVLLKSKSDETAASNDDVSLTLQEIERRHAARVLKHVNGNRVKAAEMLGISRGTLYRLVPNDR